MDKCLLKADAAVDHADNGRWTRLRCFSAKHHPVVAKCLVAAGVLLKSTTAEGLTPLTSAEMHGNHDMADALRGAKAALSVTTSAAEPRSMTRQRIAPF